VCHGTNGTLVTGKPGVVGMDVYSLGKAAECNEQNTRKSEKLDADRDAVCAKLEQKSLILRLLYRLADRENDREIDAKVHGNDVQE
jgi:hypothetical protein